MRYWAVKIDGVDASVFPPVPGALVPGAQFSSVANGQNDPGALECKFELAAYLGGTPDSNSNSFIRLYGVSLAMISQAAKLTGKQIQIYGGMYDGLPLALVQRPNAGLLVQGEIRPAFGNWIGTDMSLDMVVTASAPAPSSGASGASGAASAASGGAGSGATAGGAVGAAAAAVTSLFGGGGPNAKPLNLIHNMRPQQLLADAIRQTLSVAFPGAKIVTNISPNLVLASQDAGIYQSLRQYAAYLNTLSRSILGNANYNGVRVAIDGNTITAYDGTKQGKGKQIQFYDLIGQPTWVDNNKINFKTVLRADIKQDDTVTLPAGLQSVQQGAAQTAAGGFVTFGGDFKVSHILHFGDSRQPDGQSWNTSFEALVLSADNGQAAAAAAGGATNAKVNPNANDASGGDAVASVPTSLVARVQRQFFDNV